MKSIILLIIILLFQLKYDYISFAQSFNTVNVEINPNKMRLNPSDSSFSGNRLKTQIKAEAVANKMRQHRLSPVTQPFRLCLPLKRIYITSKFGQRFHPILGRSLKHNGVDLRADYMPVYSISIGVIERIGKDKRSGNYVIINNFGGIETIFCHLAKILVQVGDTVKSGDIFAISGATGMVTGPHLHFGLKIDGRFVNPVPLLLAIDRKLKGIEDSNKNLVINRVN